MQATNTLKTIKILLLIVQFHNVPSNLANLDLGETGIGYQSPRFHKTDNDAKKNRLQDFYDIIYLHM